MSVKEENSSESYAIDVLTQMQSDAPVRVVLRAPESELVSDVPKPSDFASFIDYRKALIQRHRLAHASEKSKIEALATSMGLSAHSASTVNAITVEGAAGMVLALLKAMPVMSAVLDRPLRRISKPKAFG